MFLYTSGELHALQKEPLVYKFVVVSML